MMAKQKSNSTLWLVFIGLYFGLITTISAGEMKIGFVNAAQVIEEAPQADLARKQLEKEFSPRDKEIIKEQKQLRKLEEKLSRDGPIMSENERVKLDRDIRTRKRELKRAQEEFREDLNIRRNEAFEKLRRRVFEVIVTIAEEQKYDLIVSDGVVYASKQIDITKLIIQQLNQEMKNSSKK